MLFKNVEWSNSPLRHFKIKTLLRINCSMAAISAFGVTERSQIFHFSLETEFNALRFINYTIPRLCSTYAVATIAPLSGLPLDAHGYQPVNSQTMWYLV